VVFEWDKPILIRAISLRSANDIPERDPNSVGIFCNDFLSKSTDHDEKVLANPNVEQFWDNQQPKPREKIAAFFRRSTISEKKLAAS